MKWPIELPAGGIDALTYWGSWPHWPAAADETTLLKNMDRLGIERSVVISLQTAFGDATAGNDELARLLARHPERLVGLVTFDPRRAVPPADVMRRGQDAGMRGLALLPCEHRYGLGDEPLVQEALWLTDNLKWPAVIPIRLVMCWWMPSTPVADIIDVARAHPRVKMLVAGGSNFENDTVARAMSELRNIHIEISGAQSLDFLVETVEFGDTRRILFGSGQPIQMPECNLVKLASPALDDRTRDAILHDNARRLFRL